MKLDRKKKLRKRKCKTPLNFHCILHFTGFEKKIKNLYHLLETNFVTLKM